MAAKQLRSTSLLLLLFLAFVAFASSEGSHEVEKKLVESAVEGVVYCQSCARVGTSSLTDAKPISSAKVGVACKDYKGRVSFYKAFETDPNGYFYAPLDGHKIEHSYLDHPLQACKVHLLSSPETSCNVPSNINSGLVGCSLRYEKKRLLKEDSENVLYAAGLWLSVLPIALLQSTNDDRLCNGFTGFECGVSLNNCLSIFTVFSWCR